MEYVFGLSGGRRAVLYDEGNFLYIQFVGNVRNMQGGARMLGRDFHSCFCCVMHREAICMAYINVANELVWDKAGRENRLILFADTGNAWEMRNLYLVSDEKDIFLFYLVQNPNTGESEIRYLLPEGDRKSRVLKSEKEKIEDYEIVKKKEEWYLNYSIAGEEKKYCFRLEDLEVVSLEEWILCKQEKVGELENIRKMYRQKEAELMQANEQLAQMNEQLTQVKEQCMQKDEILADLKERGNRRVEEIERSYKGQYDELAKLTEEIQKEGKRWRDLYYKNLEKKE